MPTTRAAPRASPGAEPATPRHAAVAATGVAPLKQAWSQVSPAGSSAAPPTGVATVLGRSDVLPGDFGALALDPTLGRVFVSSPSAGAVSVLDLDARLVGTLESIPGAGALWVDGNRLYVAAATAGRIAVFDTATLDPVATLADGLLVNPTSLVKAGGRLWTTTGRCRSDEVRIVSIDPASGAVVVHPAVDLMSYCISLTASPAAPDVLLAFEDGRSAAVIHRLDVSGPAPVASISRSVGGLENLRQLAVLPGGSGFVAAAGAPHDIRQFRLSDLDVDGTCYITGAYPNAVAATAGSGGLLAAGRTGLEPTVDVFRIGDPSARVVAYRPPAPGHVMDRGLAWSPDGGRLLVMTGRIHPVRDVRLDVLGVPA